MREQPGTDDTDAGNPPSDPVLTHKLLLLTGIMFVFGFALVPLYDVFCDITGLGGRTDGTAAAAVVEAPDLTREITLEFTGTVNQSAPWRFTPVQAKMKVHPGKLYTARYTAQNLTGIAMVGQAVPSVAPGLAAKHLRKTDCFCFEQQQFDAHEQRELEVRFIVDTALPAHIDTLTLSYTFFDQRNMAAN